MTRHVETIVQIGTNDNMVPNRRWIDTVENGVPAKQLRMSFKGYTKIDKSQIYCYNPVSQEPVNFILERNRTFLGYEENGKHIPGVFDYLYGGRIVKVYGTESNFPKIGEVKDKNGEMTKVAYANSTIYVKRLEFLDLHFEQTATMMVENLKTSSCFQDLGKLSGIEIASDITEERFLKEIKANWLKWAKPHFMSMRKDSVNTTSSVEKAQESPESVLSNKPLE